MKTRTILSLLVFVMISALGQNATVELTFTAENNGQYVPLDSILIENLSQGGDTTLYAPDTVLVWENVAGIGDNDAIGRNTFYVSQNYPNPFKGKTEFNLYLPGKEYIKITVRDIVGRELAQYENSLDHGNHSLAFYPGNEKYYLLTVTGKKTSQTIKMLNSSSTRTNGGQCKLVYLENMGNNIGYKSQDAINGFVFNMGDELKYTTYTDVEETEIINTPTGSQTFTFQFDGWTPCPGTSIVTDIDGNIYNTVLIGDQCWMKENLKTTTYQNGNAIPNVTGYWDFDESGAYAWYDDDISWKDLYGALYSWYAAVNPNGICPTGWHVSTNDEWTDLTDYIGSIWISGTKLKTCRQVNSPFGGACNTSEHPRWNFSSDGGTDDYGFSGLPGGLRSYGASFNHRGVFASWWSSTEYPLYSLTHAWHRQLYFTDGNVWEGNSTKRNGFSVRCLKD